MRVRAWLLVVVMVVRSGLAIAWDWLVLTLVLWVPPIAAGVLLGPSGWWFVLWFCSVGLMRSRGFLRGRVLGSAISAAAAGGRADGANDVDSGSPVPADGASAARKPEAERLIRAVLTSSERERAVAEPARPAPLVTPARSVVLRRRNRESVS